MPRINLQDFSRGLWLNGAPDVIPDGSLRRATGVSSIRGGLLRSARGMRQLYSGGANSYQRFNSSIYAGQGAEVTRDGAVVGGNGDLDGTRLHWLRMPPHFDLIDWLFYAGGGKLRKISPVNIVSKWGIDAPPDGLTASLGIPQAFEYIEDFEDFTDWTARAKANALADDATIKIAGTNSLSFRFSGAPGDAVIEKTFTAPINLNAFHAASFDAAAGRDNKSAEQDFISVWVRCTRPDLLTFIEFSFSLGDATFKEMYTRRVEFVDTPVTTAGSALEQVGLAQDHSETDVVAGTGEFADDKQLRTILNQLGRTNMPRISEQWVKLLLPKTTFDRTGVNAALSWENAFALRITLRATARDTTSPVGSTADPNIWLDEMLLLGGSPLQGSYSYQQTFKNSVTGNESNPNPTPVVIANVDRRGVLVGNLAQPTDPQIDKIPLYRTVGNGALRFLVAELDVGTFTYRDYVGDFFGMYSGEHIDSDTQEVLQNQQVKLDNDPPEDTYEYATGPHLGRSWWAGDTVEGAQGRLYYSPEGRPESVQGFVDVSPTDDPTNRPIIWQEQIWQFTQKKIFRIDGETEPFRAFEVFGAPGTTEPETIVPTPFGIVYRAHDGVRRFDGMKSELVGYDAMAPVLRGFAVENVPARPTLSAAFRSNEYFMADGEQILVLDLETGTWRHLDLSAFTLYSEADETNLLIASLGSQVAAGGETFALEDESADTAIHYEVQTAQRRVSVDAAGVLQRLFVEIDTGGQEITPILLLDDLEIELPVITNAARAIVEYARTDAATAIAVRLTGAVLASVLLYAIAVDVELAGAISE